MRVVTMVALVLSFTPCAAVAEYNGFAAGRALTTLAVADHLLTVFQNSECGLYGPKGLAASKLNMKKAATDFEASLPKEDQRKFKHLIKSVEFQANLRGIEKRLITDILALHKQNDANHAFACGVVYGGILQVMMSAESQRFEAQQSIH